VTGCRWLDRGRVTRPLRGHGRRATDTCFMAPVQPYPAESPGPPAGPPIRPGRSGTLRSVKWRRQGSDHGRGREGLPQLQLPLPQQPGVEVWRSPPRRSQTSRGGVPAELAGRSTAGDPDLRRGDLEKLVKQHDITTCGSRTPTSRTSTSWTRSPRGRVGRQLRICSARRTMLRSTKP